MAYILYDTEADINFECPTYRTRDEAWQAIVRKRGTCILREKVENELNPCTPKYHSKRCKQCARSVITPDNYLKDVTIKQ